MALLASFVGSVISKVIAWAVLLALLTAAAKASGLFRPIPRRHHHDAPCHGVTNIRPTPPRPYDWADEEQP